ncbi:hypotheical protein [Schistosoma mansoni]|uniref:hypotheical protein n=1 Tax=Schistosoma mansoni TaxID=6183 RepID=UPI0001A63678|nr:hypotheical protein [Schistosoma mansoni]|eukprot:XP_018653583.1 hypotheical protein [Schistosoma mansoni]
MRHILCPNSCSYGAVRCSGKPHVIKSVSNIKKSIPASIGDCIPIRLGVFDHEYKCLCEKGYSWNSDTRSCEIEDPCTLDQILSIKAHEIKGKDRLCDPKGTLRCIYTQYYKNKDIFGYQIRLTLHYSCICHPQFMGYRCDRLRNPCIEILCQNKGMCISSGDGKQFLCLCEYGWGGKYCTEPGIRQWFPWSPWSECSAAFYEDHGWKRRTRECRSLGNESIYLGKCSGNEMELRTCIGR